MSRPAPTRRAAVLLAVAAVAAFGLPPAAGLALLVAALVGIGGDVALARGPLRATRDPVGSLARGVDADVRVHVEATGRVRVVAVHQPAGRGLRVRPLQPGPQGLWAATVTALRRGQVELPPVVVDTVGPWRLGGWRRGVGPPEAVTVGADLPAARRAVRGRRPRVPLSFAGISQGPVGPGSDFETLRPYSPDDDVRTVNWRATARRGEPLVNTFRTEQGRRLLIAVDCGRTMAAPLRAGSGLPLTRLDVAVDLAAALALAGDDDGDRCGLLAFDASVRAALAPRQRGAGAVLAALAPLAPRLLDTDPGLLLAALHRAPRTGVCLLGDLTGEQAVEPLAEVCRALTRQHPVLVASPLDEDLIAALSGPARLARAAAALEAERTAAVALLRASGAVVVSAPLTSLMPAVLSAAATL